MFSEPYLDSDTKSMIGTISKAFAFNNNTNFGVSAIDLDMGWVYYRDIVNVFPGIDHFFIIDKKYRVYMYSKAQ